MFESGKRLSDYESLAARYVLKTDGEVEIWFNPNQKFSGVNWSVLRGFITTDEAERVVNALNSWSVND